MEGHNIDDLQNYVSAPSIRPTAGNMLPPGKEGDYDVDDEEYNEAAVQMEQLSSTEK